MTKFLNIVALVIIGAVVIGALRYGPATANVLSTGFTGANNTLSILAGK